MKKSRKISPAAPARVNIYARRTHNFRQSATYLLRLEKSVKFNGWFGVVEDDPRILTGVFTRPTEAGEIIIRNIDSWAKANPEIMLHQYVVMPDHVHILFRVCKTLPYHLCNYIINLTLKIEREIGEIFPGPIESVFSHYSDPKVLLIPFDLNAYVTYLRHNPYRKAMMIRHPELLCRATALTIDGNTYDAYGNLFLFRNPDKIIVEFGEKDGAWKKERLHSEYKRKITEGSVIVSPFLNADEQKVLHIAERNGGKVIKIKPCVINFVFDPTPNEKYLCSCGKQLLISPRTANGTTITDVREDELRAIAEIVATHTY